MKYLFLTQFALRFIDGSTDIKSKPRLPLPPRTVGRGLLKEIDQSLTLSRGFLMRKGNKHVLRGSFNTLPNVITVPPPLPATNLKNLFLLFIVLILFNKPFTVCFTVMRLKLSKLNQSTMMINIFCLFEPKHPKHKIFQTDSKLNNL